MIDSAWLTDLDADATCAAVADAHADLLAAEARQLYLAAHWADLHSGEALQDRRRRAGVEPRPGRERARHLGADGTPSVAEFAPAELGVLLGVGPVAADNLVRDSLNLRHRHPLLWVVIDEGGARAWQARAVAKMCAAAGLDRAQAQWVDATTTPYVSALPWGRFESLVEAKIIEVDPEAAEQRRLAAAMERFVRTGQSNEFGLKTVIARANAGDAIFFVAMVDRIATVLALHGDKDPVDVRRSKALGILANPAGALRLLASVIDMPGASDTPPDKGADDPTEVSETDVHPSQSDADDPLPGASGDPTTFMKALAVDRHKLLPAATLYIHLSEAALSSGTGVARMEGVGPITVEQVVEFLRHTNVRTVPVVDPAGQTPVDAYEVPSRMREALHLRSPACAFPWSSNLSRRKDMDHPIPYVPPDRGGPPGQTCMENLAPLGRFAHRLKTHGRWRLRQTGPGVYLWRGPRGHLVRVGPDGSRLLGRHTTLPCGGGTVIDLYEATVTLRYEHAG